MAIQPYGDNEIKVDKISEKTPSAGVEVVNATTFDAATTLKASATFSGSNVGLLDTVEASISAAGTNQAGATALTKTINIVSTVSSGLNEGVKLPSQVTGRKIQVSNSSAAPLKVYPSSGQQILPTYADYPVAVFPSETKTFIGISSGVWTVDKSRWISWTPTITPAAGSWSVVLSSGKYRHESGLLTTEFLINGTLSSAAASYLSISLPGGIYDSMEGLEFIIGGWDSVNYRQAILGAVSTAGSNILYLYKVGSTNFPTGTIYIRGTFSLRSDAALW